jgi:hypothetical protein
VPTRLRESRQVRVSTRRTPKRKLKVPPELGALITAEIEDEIALVLVRFDHVGSVSGLGGFHGRDQRKESLGFQTQRKWPSIASGKAEVIVYAD